MTPTELHQILNTLQIRPRKGLSQNFLIDSNIARKIISTLDPKKKVLEIGPGLGALTQILLEQGFRVTAVEKDKKISEYLRNQFTNLDLYEEDFLSWNFDHLTEGDVQIVSNLPYHITTPILERVLSRPDIFISATVMMQTEVTQRIVAKPKSPEYGSLSVFLQSRTRIESLFSVSANCFYPRPQVGSSILHLTMKTTPKEGFSFMTRLAFQKRRKTLVNALKEEYDPKRLIPALEKLGFSPTVRAEELSVEKFHSLFEIVS